MPLHPLERKKISFSLLRNNVKFVKMLKKKTKKKLKPKPKQEKKVIKSLHRWDDISHAKSRDTN